MKARISANVARLVGPGRIGGIDAARGLAVFGMLAAHMIGLPSLDPVDPSTWGAIATGRSSILFATLAGVSVSIMTGGMAPHTGERARVDSRRLIVRAIVIAVLGVLLLALGTPLVVILPMYGVLFLLAVPLLKVPVRMLPALAVVLALVTPFIWEAMDGLPFWDRGAGEAIYAVLGLHYPFVVWVTFLVAGMAIGRSALHRVRTAVLLAVIGGAVSLAGYVFGREWRSLSGVTVGEGGFLDGALAVDPHSSGLGEVLGSGGFAIFVIGVMLLVTRGAVGTILAPLRAVGSMPLTAYSAQIVVVAILLIGVAPPEKLSVLRDAEVLWPFVLWTVIGCTAWAVFVGRGPLEGFVNRLSKIVAPTPVERPPR